MKQIITLLIGIISCLLITSCENDIQGLYSGEHAIYFSEYNSTADSVTYSFIGKNREQDTVFLNVRLLGNMLTTPAKVVLRVVPEKTTAISGSHFEAIKPSYQFGLNTFDYKLPIILKKHADLNSGAFVLALEIVESEDLLVAFKEKSSVRIRFSNIFMKPSIWDATLAPVFGIYSKTKHAICMDIMGRPFPETLVAFNVERNLWRNFGWQCNAYFKDNIVMDNDLVPPARILPWF
ncbi:MAG: hypothetical protein CVU10_07310 [Bacteroidetes bacterium HGW-Bacteroidetes-5]|jgi:hypothetical protein|nr:MAG: hypothetical protein CVU10_07310 [Bacteroidetes bacterium HGW-Bacteroidetes-5]